VIKRQPRGGGVASALTGLAKDLGACLVSLGWTRQDVPWRVAVFTRPVGETSFVATVEVLRVGKVTGPDEWPVDLVLRYGCGHTPTVALMRRIGLDVDPVLVEEPVPPANTHLMIQMSDASDVGRVVNILHEDVSAHRMDFAISLSSDGAMERALGDDHLTPPDVRTELIPSFLAAVGRLAQAREAAQRYLSEQDAEDQQEYAEFVQALHELPDAQ
jgi:hypothetical protein